jgi:hypothetical protein
MSGHSTDPFSDQVHKATSPTPGFRGATSGPSAPGVRDNHPTRQGRGGGRRGTQGCPSRIAHSPDKVLHWERKTGHIAANGRTARPSENLSSQPPRPAGLRVTSRYGPTRTTVESFDRSQCPGKPGATGKPKHGTRSAYDNFGCRCPDAILDKSRKAKLRRLGRKVPAHIPAVGTTRRLQALAHLGYSPAVIAGDFCTGMQLATLRDGKCKGVTRAIAKHVLEFYVDHEDQPLPVVPSTRQVRNTAKRRKWTHPLRWAPGTIDNPDAEPLNYHRAQERGAGSVNEEVDLQLLLSGHAKNLPSSTVEDRQYWRKLTLRAVHILTERGYTIEETAEKLKIPDRRVLRHRKINTGEAVGAGRHNGDAQLPGTTPSGNSTPREACVA